MPVKAKYRRLERVYGVGNVYTLPIPYKRLQSLFWAFYDGSSKKRNPSAERGRHSTKGLASTAQKFSGWSFAITPIVILFRYVAFLNIETE